MSLDINLTNVQSKPIVVSANQTAENDRVYNVIANATFTDPTGVNGKGYFVVVRFGTSVVLGGNSYTAGETIYRIFNAGTWLNIALRPSTYESLTNKKTTLTDNSDTFYPTQKAVKTAVDAKFNTPTGTTAQYLRGDGSLETFPTIPDPADFVEKSDFTSHSILAKQSGGSDPVAVSIGNNEILGRKSGGGSDIEGLSVSEVKAILNYTASDVGAVATNTAITGATKTKITYDAKGLVTAGADATTADIADSTDKRYVTDAQLTVIGNTSGTNTGDQTLSGLSGVPTTRTITINGTTQDLSADRTYSAVLLSGQPNTANTGVSGALRYFGFSNSIVSVNEILRRTFLPNDCTLKNFYIRTSGAQPVTGSHVLTILKNGVATSITITIPAGSAAGVFSDTTNSESFAAGNEVSIQAVNNASANSGGIIGYSIGNL